MYRGEAETAERRVGALPLSGVAVVDAGGATTAYCAKLLWDLGAEVTVLEPPGGHVLRTTPPFDHRDCASSLVFDWYHGGSAAVVVDPQDLEALAAATAGADVVLVAPEHSPWPSSDEHPQWAPAEAVVCSVTPFGRGGPYQQVRATHLVSIAIAGGVHRYGPVDGPPLAPPAQIHWDCTGAHAALAVVTALRARPWAGGQAIDISAQEFETTVDYFFERFGVAGAPPAPRMIGVGIPPTGIWKCADGVFEISAHQEHHWDAFVALVGNPADLAEPSLRDMATRRLLADGLAEVIADLFASQSSADLFARAQALGLPSSVLNTPAQFVADEQLQARRAIVEREVGGRPMRLPASPLRANVRLTRDTPGDDAGIVADHVPSGSPSRPPLDGVRVLSLGAFLAGNTAAGLLAGLGADVAKVEAYARPEVLRRPSFGFEARTYTEPSGVGTTPMFAVLARGAQNLGLDIKHPSGLELFRRLVTEVDVVLENFGTGAMERAGLGFDALTELNPRLVVLSMSGYGRTGPRSSYLAYAGNISNFTGITALQAPQGQLSDAATAVHGALAVVAALDHARRIDRPIHLDIAQIEVVASCLAPALLDPLTNGVDTTPHHNDIPGSLFSGVVRCIGIDSWVAIEATDVEQCSALAVLVERPDLCPDDRLDDQQHEELRDAVEAWCATRTRHCAAQLLQHAGVAAGAVQSVEDVVRDPQLRHRRFPASLPHPDLGTLEYPGALHHFSVTATAPTNPAPRLGSSTRDILRRWLAIDDDELASFEAAGAIASFDPT